MEQEEEEEKEVSLILQNVQRLSNKLRGPQFDMRYIGTLSFNVNLIYPLLISFHFHILQDCKKLSG